MVTPALKRDFIRAGIGVIPLEAGARSLIDELACGDAGATEVVIGDALPESPEDGIDPPPVALPDLSTVFERTLDLDRHPFLLSHVIGGYPVLPVAVIQEWLGHALNPEELGTPPIRRLSGPKRTRNVGFMTDKADSMMPG